MWTACQCIHSSAQLVESIFRSCWKTWQSVLHLSRMICHLVYVMKLRYSAHRLIFKWHWNTWQSAGWCHTLILSFFLCTFRDSWAYCGCHVGTTLVTFCHQFEVQLHLARTLWCTTFSQGDIAWKNVFAMVSRCQCRKAQSQYPILMMFRGSDFAEPCYWHISGHDMLQDPPVHLQCYITKTCMLQCGLRLIFWKPCVWQHGCLFSIMGDYMYSKNCSKSLIWEGLN